MKRVMFILILICVAVGITFFPHRFPQFLGMDAGEKAVAVAIAENASQLAEGNAETLVSIENEADGEVIFKFFQSYRYRKANIDYEKLKALPISYTVFFSDAQGREIKVVTAGDKYAVFTFQGCNETMKVFGGSFDLRVLEEIYETL